MKPVTGNITGYRLTGNRLTTLIHIQTIHISTLIHIPILILISALIQISSHCQLHQSRGSMTHIRLTFQNSQNTHIWLVYFSYLILISESPDIDKFGNSLWGRYVTMLAQQSVVRVYISTAEFLQGSLNDAQWSNFKDSTGRIHFHLVV